MIDAVPRIARACLPLAFAASLASCTAQPSEPLGFAKIPEPCGVTAAMRVGTEEWQREKPRACDLPTAQGLAQTCAIYDVVRAPGYRPAPTDEFGEPVYDPDQPPLPVYKVQNLQCRFTNSRHNEAECSFDLSTPEDAGDWQSTTVPMEHRFWADHGPASHVYSTQWWMTRSCRPSVTEG